MVGFRDWVVPRDSVPMRRVVKGGALNGLIIYTSVGGFS